MAVEVKQQWTGEPLEGAVEVELKFAMPIPKSASKKAQSAMYPRGDDSATKMSKSKPPGTGEESGTFAG